MKRFFAAMIYTYQLAARAVLPRACRFAPSCSDYAREAVELHGFKGAAMALRRISRCHPLHRGGWDPVPAEL